MGMIGNTLAQGLISGANIQDGTVDTPDIKDSAVTAAKIASGVVTPAKMDFSAGTANGVAYLNGSKVLTTGSALTFDGTTLSNTGKFSKTRGSAGTTGTPVSEQAFVYTDGSALSGVYGVNAHLSTNATWLNFVVTNAAGSAFTAATIDASGSLLVGSATKQVAVSTPSFWTSSATAANGGIGFIPDYEGAGEHGLVSYSGNSTTFKNLNVEGNTVKFWTGSAGSTTERARIDSTGNVGIGTSTPVADSGWTTLTLKGTQGGELWFQDPSGTGTYTTSQGFVGSGSTALSMVAYGVSRVLSFGTVGAERMRLDVNGNLLLGTTTLTPITTGIANLNLGSTSATTTGGIAYQISGATAKAYDYVESNVRKLQTISGVSIAFIPAGTEAARFDSSGNFMVGTTLTYGTGGSLTGAFGGTTGSVNPKAVCWGQYSTNSGWPQYVGNWASSGTWGIGPHSGSSDSIVRIGFVNSAASTGVSWTGSYVNIYAGAYTNASDYRIKDNVTNVADGVLAKVMALRVINYNVIHQPDEDGDTPPVKDEVGFLAHEIQDHFPILVSGEKDAVDGEGNAQHQGVDYAKLSAYLAKAMQEQQAIIESLTQRITALETP